MAIIVAAVVAPASPTALASSSIGPSADPTTVSLSLEVGRPHEPPLLVHRGERRSAESRCGRSFSSQALSSGAPLVCEERRHSRLPCVPPPEATVSLLIASSSPLHRQAVPPKRSERLRIAVQSQATSRHT